MNRDYKNVSTLVSLSKSTNEEAMAGAIYAMPATPIQVRLWNLNKVTPDPAWNIAVRFRLSGPLDRDKFEHAMQTLTTRHEALRTSFEMQSGAVIERIAAQVTLPVEWCDLRSMHAEAQAAEVAHLSLDHASQIMSLQHAPLLRVRVLRLAEEENILVWNAHHSICDGWSVGLLASNLMDCYGELLHGSEPAVRDSLDYGDYAVWLDAQRKTPEYEAHRSYWKQRLQGLRVPALPAAWRNSESTGDAAAIQSVLLPRTLTDSILSIAQRHDSTFFHAVLAAFALLMRVHQSSTEVVVETPISGRDQSELEGVVGAFVNTLALRVGVDADMRFSSLLHDVRDLVADSFEHAQFRYEDLLADLEQDGTIASSEKPLTPVAFICQQDFVRPITAGGIDLTAVPSVSPGALRPLTVFMVERADGWRLSCEVDNRIVSRAAGSVLLEDFQRLLRGIVATPEGLTAQLVTQAGLAPMDSVEASVGEGDWPASGNLAARKENAHGGVRIPATEFQQRFWRLDSLNRGGIAFHVRIRLELKGVCNVEALAEAIAHVARRNEILRTTLEETDDQIWQVIHPELPIDFQFQVSETLAPDALRSPAQRLADQAILDREGQEGFSLSNGPLFRVRVLQLEADRIWLAITLSHGIVDGWSSGLFLQQLQQAYEQIVFGGKGEKVSPVQFSVYARMEQKLLASPEKDRRLAWWQEYLGGVWSPLELPRDIAESVDDVGDARARLEVAILDRETVAKVRSFARECQTTVFAVYGALFQSLLFRYSRQNDILFLTPHANRTDNTETIMGPLAGPICLTAHIGAETTFRELVTRFGQESMDAMEHALPLNLITPLVDMRVGRQYHPLNQITFFYQRAFVHDMEWKDLRVASLPDVPSVTGSEWQLGVVERDAGMFLEFLYDTTLYSQATIQTVQRHYAHLLAHAVKTPDTALSQLEILTPEEKDQYSRAKSLPPVMESLLQRKPVVAAETAAPVERETVAPARRDAATQSERDMLRIWRQVLKIEDLDMESNFFDLGGHSLLLARLQIVMKREFNVQLTAAEVFRQPTIGTLAAWLEQARSTTPTAKPSSSRPWEQNPHIVPIQPLGAGHPIFVISQSMIFRTFAAELGTDQPVYAVQTLEQDAATMASATFEQMVDFYVRLIREVQPSGPYRVAGWCVSGWIAYGVARRLEQLGEKIEMVLILDAWAPDYWSGQPLMRRQVMLTIYHGLRLRRKIRPPSQIGQPQSSSFRRGLQEFAVASGKLIAHVLRLQTPAETGQAEEARLDNQLQETARHASRSGPLVGQALVLRSEEEPGGPMLADDMGWSHVIGRPVRVDIVPGNHHEIFNLPGARMMALRVREMLGVAPISLQGKKAPASNVPPPQIRNGSVPRVEG